MYQCSIHGWISMFESCPKCATPVVSVATTNTNYVVETQTPDKKMEELIEQLKKLSPESPMGNDVSKAFHGGIQLAIIKAKFLLEAEREYASQQVPAIPYQCCPICNGEGKLLSKLMTTVYEVCSVCKGDKIIPMFTASQQAPACIKPFVSCGCGQIKKQ